MSVDLQVRYDVLLRENARLRALIDALAKDLAGLRPPPAMIVPRTFGDDTPSVAQDAYNRGMTAEVNRGE